jgi:hypothetical protein
VQLKNMHLRSAVEPLDGGYPARDFVDILRIRRERRVVQEKRNLAVDQDQWSAVLLTLDCPLSSRRIGMLQNLDKTVPERVQARLLVLIIGSEVVI